MILRQVHLLCDLNIPLHIGVRLRIEPQRHQQHNRQQRRNNGVTLPHRGDALAHKAHGCT